LEDFILHDITEGLPQGSPIFPPLANLTLNDFEEYIGKKFLTTKYADNFVIVGKSSEELCNVALLKINSFLLERGLKLDLDKTRIFFIEEGFDFLCLNFREYLNEH
jgi:RNA-directed DNA polymerase